MKSRGYGAVLGQGGREGEAEEDEGGGRPRGKLDEEREVGKAEDGTRE